MGLEISNRENTTKLSTVHISNRNKNNSQPHYNISLQPGGFPVFRIRFTLLCCSVTSSVCDSWRSKANALSYEQPIYFDAGSIWSFFKIHFGESCERSWNTPAGVLRGRRGGYKRDGTSKGLDLLYSICLEREFSMLVACARGEEKIRKKWEKSTNFLLAKVM